MPGTPYYEIDEEKLNAEIFLLTTSLHRCWGDNAIAAWSVKTNALPWLLEHVRRKGLYAEVVSGNEYELAERIGFPRKNIIYNGPIKERAFFERALAGGSLVNLDSEEELEWLEEDAMEAARKKESLRVGLRVNIDFAGLIPGEIPADEEGSRFGYCEENGKLGEVIARLRSYGNILVTGLHLHSSTKSRSVEAYARVAAFAVCLAKKYDLQDLAYIDMGGGFYGGVPGKPDFSDYVPAITKELAAYFDPSKITLILEPGVSLVSSSFSFFTRVRDVRNIKEHRYVVIDGSRLNLNPQVTRRWYPHHFLYRMEEGDYERTAPGRSHLPSQMICGSTCMEYDRLFEVENEAELKRGDLVVFDRAGGYTVCLTPLFIHYFPAVIVKRADGSFFTAREPWTNKEYLQKNHWKE